MMKSRLVTIGALFLLILIQPAFAFNNPFQKKYDKSKEEGEEMVHTVDEWMESATSVKMDMRKREDAEKEKNENLIPPESELPTVLERYNVKAGSRELNLTQIYKTQHIRSIFVADPKFEHAVYTEVYLYPQTRQLASTMFLIELDGHLGKKDRLKDVSVFEHTRYPLISTALPYLKDELYSTVTVVDFSSDGKMILAKEKRGSNRYGLYETYVWIYYLTDEDRESNTCYLNNISFSNEMTSFDGIDGRTGGIKGNKSESSEIPNINEKIKFDLNNLENVPDVNLTPNGTYNDRGGRYPSIKSAPLAGQVKNAMGTTQAGPMIDDNKDLSWVNEHVVKINKQYPGAEFGFKKENLPTLTYKEMRSFIKSVWKDDVMTSPFKTRWYNEIPVDFRVDDSYVSGKDNIGFGVRLNLLNEMIKAYWFDRKKLILNHIRWDLRPLGFSANNKDEIIVESWAYGKEGQEISLGRWAVNVNNGIPRLIDADENIQIEANGFIVEEKLNPR